MKFRLERGGAAWHCWAQRFAVHLPYTHALYDADTDEMTTEDREHWDQAVNQAEPGQVFVQGIVPGGQAETMGIFLIGDRLHGIGELPFEAGGFEQAVEMVSE